MQRLLLTLILILTSCAKVVQKIDANGFNPAASNQKLHLVFSHNISGETHPCGCRQFPLGGLSQVAGLFADLKKDGELLYVDTGDTFFPSSVIPQSMHQSLTFAANNLAVGLEKLGLKYFIPGDQDFARGMEFLKNLSEVRKFTFLISNLNDNNQLKNEKIAKVEMQNAKLFFIGLVNPEAINTKEAIFFTDVEKAMPEIMNQLQAAGYNASNPFHRLIVLSHAGIDLDEKLAEKYPQIDWIIGAHSQSFLRFSRDVGNTKMVQVLSKNHYVGEVTIDLLAKKDADTYTLHEIRDELAKKLEPNPMTNFIDEHKAKLSEIQLKEQAEMSFDYNPKKKANTKVVTKFKTANSCIACHQAQGEFWQTTPHSLAYLTLINAKEENNLSCVKCHSLGLNDDRGFKTAKTIVQFEGKTPAEYLTKLKAIAAPIKSVRQLSSEETKVHAKKWWELDREMKVKHNFANVQCLNCHTKGDEHPYVQEKTDKVTRLAEMKNKCLSCHTRDQSPEWYEKDQKGLAKNIDNQVLDAKIKKMSCPSLQ